MVEVYAMSETKFAHFSIQELRYRSPAIEFFFYHIDFWGSQSETQIFNVVQKRGIAHLLFTTPPRQFNRIHSNLHILFFFISH
jgi:hypothetical protein